MAYGAYSGVDTLQNQVQAQAELEEAKKGQQAAVTAQKKKMSSEFQEQLKAAQDRAKKKAKKKSGLFKALNFAGMFLGPMGQAITGAVSGGLQAKQQRDAMKELMKGPQFERFKGTFLGDMAQEQMQMAKDQQQAAGASLLGGLMGGITGFAGGKLLGGKGMKSGFFEGVGKGQGRGMLPFQGGSGPLSPDNLLQGPLTPRGFMQGGGRFGQFFKNVGQKFNPANMSQRAAGMIPGADGGGWFNKLLGGVQSAQNINKMAGGEMDMLQALMQLTPDNEEETEENQNTTQVY
tara:strand:+ start:2386 stop:3258 length:873 start_codon:yes stop_codon:yes gene_type:complete